MEEATYSKPSDQLVQEYNQPEQQQPQQSAPTTSDFVWKFFSVMSWLLLIFTSLDAYFHEKMFFSIFNNNILYFPLSVKLGSIQSFYLIILFLGFYHYAYLGLYKGDESITNPLLNSAAKFHFVPLFLISFINIINQFIKQKSEKSNDSEDINLESILIADLVFTIIALIFLIIVYAKTALEHNWYIVLTIKKGVFSCLIILLWHNFFYLIVLVGNIVKVNRGEDEEIFSLFKGAGIAGSLIIGIGGSIFAFSFKDLIAATTNFLLYVGMVNSFFGTTGKSKEMKLLTGGVADGVIEIIFMLFSFATILILSFCFSADCVK